jgi:flagellar hook-associated protein 3 FlgL
MRLATANTFDTTIDNIAMRQSELARQQDKVSAGMRVTRASDDPISAARAERALSRITYLQAEQRALNVQRDGLAIAESTLGDAGTLLQRFRELAVSVGNATNSANDRTTIANEMQSLREQVFALANTRDSNGVYLFSGLESAKVQGVTTPPFTVTGAPPTQQYQYNGTPGQNSPTQMAVPYTVDGDSTWMQVPKGNGAFDVTLGAANTGQISTDIGQFSTTPVGGTLASSYQISFTVTGNVTTYSVDTVPATVPIVGGTYVPGQPIQFTDTATAPDVNVSLTVYGKPATGDTVSVAPYTLANPANASVFELMDKVINGVKGVSSVNPGLMQTVAQGLTRIDAGMDKLQAARGQAGLWLNRADSITASNEGLANQLETDRSNAQDLDMVRGISDQEKMQTGYKAALQSYAQIQKLSLFDYIR